MSKQNILVTVTGPSLTGKSKLANLLAPEGFDELVSTTTRPPREGEIDGVHYTFVDVETFKKMSANKQMIEEVVVGKNFYGVSRPALDTVISKGKNGVAVVEPNGAQQVAKFCAENNILLHQVFINNPTDILGQRFKERYENDKLAKPEVYLQRLIDMITREPKEWIEPAYNGKHKYDQVFDLFTPENQHLVVEQITQAVNLKLNAKKNTKPRF